MTDSDSDLGTPKSGGHIIAPTLLYPFFHGKSNSRYNRIGKIIEQSYADRIGTNNEPLPLSPHSRVTHIPKHSIMPNTDRINPADLDQAPTRTNFDQNPNPEQFGDQANNTDARGRRRSLSSCSCVMRACARSRVLVLVLVLVLVR